MSKKNITRNEILAAIAMASGDDLVAIKAAIEINESDNAVSRIVNAVKENAEKARHERRFVVGYMDKHGRIMVEQGSAKSGGSIQLDSGKGCWSFQKSAEASIAMLKDEYPDSPIIYMEYIDQRHNKENDNVNDNQ